MSSIVSMRQGMILCVDCKMTTSVHQKIVKSGINSMQKSSSLLLNVKYSTLLFFPPLLPTPPIFLALTFTPLRLTPSVNHSLQLWIRNNARSQECSPHVLRREFSNSHLEMFLNINLKEKNHTLRPDPASAMGKN